MLSLDLSANRINSVPANAFSSSTNLQWLELSLNQIASLDKDTFSGLSNLLHLRLDQNSLTKAQLPGNVFSDLSGLEWLALPRQAKGTRPQPTTSDPRAHALLTGSECRTCSSGLSSLKELDLATNGITSRAGCPIACSRP